MGFAYPDDAVMNVFVKICGISNRDDAQSISRLGADALGFIFWKPSARYVDPQQVGSWDIDPRTRKVGVFVDAEPEEVARVIAVAGIDTVQLHGDEDPSDYRDLNDELWKAVHLDKDPDRDWNAIDADAYLLDSYTAEMPGGTGATLDWERAAEFAVATARPTILAGGLTPENVGIAIEAVRPWGVDVSSGVEENKRKKNLNKVEEFIALCRKI